MMASVGEQFDYERRASLKEMPSFRREAAGSLGRMDSIASIKERLDANRELLLSGAADPVQAKPWMKVAGSKKNSFSVDRDVNGHGRRVSAHDVDRNGVALGLSPVSEDYSSVGAEVLARVGNNSSNSNSSGNTRARNLSRASTNASSSSADSSFGSGNSPLHESSFEYDN